MSITTTNNSATRCALTLALAAAIAPMAAAQGPAAESGAVAAAVKRAGKKDSGVSSRSGPQEGIKVHGDWTIVIRNEDGTVASRHQFKNSLSATGAAQADLLLAQLLNGDIVFGHWLVMFAGTTGTLCGSGACMIAEPGAPLFAHAFNLSAAVPTTGPDARKLVLKAIVKVPNGGDITQVETLVETCPGTVLPASCGAPLPAFFTFRQLPGTSIQVVANQMVDVTVVIGFS